MNTDSTTSACQDVLGSIPASGKVLLSCSYFVLIVFLVIKLEAINTKQENNSLVLITIVKHPTDIELSVVVLIVDSVEEFLNFSTLMEL
uniref:SFRICE_001567 n=1 Tax=Spodoptera frugiperda TaxID=7108 RepID=A0A2H1VER3_SPOFR